MKDVKTTALGLLAGVCVFGLAAAPAFAVEEETNKRFDASIHGKTISEAEPAAVLGQYAEPQKWAFASANYKIQCERVTSTGKVTEPVSKELTVTLHFAYCYNLVKEGTETVKLKTVFSKTGLTLIYHANGWAQAFENGLGEEIPFTERTEVKMLPVAATITIPGSKVCKITLPEQFVPARATLHPEAEYSSVSYSNEEFPNANKKLFPSGIQQKLLIVNEFHKLKFAFTGGQCAENKEQGTQASYSGTIREAIKTGNIGIEEL